MIVVPPEFLARLDEKVAMIARDQGPREPINLEVAPDWFHAQQLEAWESESDIVAILAGWQSGKTVTLPHWLLREIQRKGPGDYGAFSTTYRLLERKFRPELERVLKPYAVYKTSSGQFVFTQEGSLRVWGDKWDGSPTIVQLGYAENPDSLESATLKGVVWDEPGQRAVPEQAFRTVQSRLMVNRGRMCLASRPYEFNWYETLCRERWFSADIISFPSWANPRNPGADDEHWKQKRASMPDWLFTMLYEGRFTRPAGLVYDCFDPNVHVIDDPVEGLPSGSVVFAGVDFGGVNMAGVFLAKTPDGYLHVFSTYENKSASVYDHAANMRMLAVRQIERAWGGAPSEDKWRRAFMQAGMEIARPRVSGLEDGIAIVYSHIKSGRVKFWRKGAAALIALMVKYSREVDEDGNVQEKIADKSTWHLMDALRYALSGFPTDQRLVKA